MNESPNTFERLVSTLESSERSEMLKRLAELTELQGEEIKIPENKAKALERSAVSSRSKLVDEPFLVRLWFAICALFSGGSPERVYSRHLVTELGKNLSRTSSEYIDVHRNIYLRAMYNELAQLRSTQIFFPLSSRRTTTIKAGFISSLAR